MLNKFNSSEEQELLYSHVLQFLEERTDTKQRSEQLKIQQVEGVPFTYILRNIFSKKECEEILKGAKHQENIQTFNETGVQRRVMRIQVKHEELADWMYKLIEPYLVQIYEVESNDERQFGRLAQGSWKVVGLNPNFRFCKYDSSGFFKPHFDGTYLESETRRTLFTILLYLNEGMEGGHTNFLDKEKWEKQQERKVVASFKPEAGSALIFPQNVIHEGAALEGTKHFVRTDIYYERDEEDEKNIDPETKLMMMETKEQAQCYLDLAREYERCSQPMKAVEYYRKAFKLNPALEAIM